MYDRIIPHHSRPVSPLLIAVLSIALLAGGCAGPAAAARQDAAFESQAVRNFSASSFAREIASGYEFQPRDYNELFSLGGMNSVLITVTRDQWNRLLSNYDRNSRNEEYVEGNFFYFTGTSDYISIPDVGLRLRGNTFSRVRPEGQGGEPHSVPPDYHQSHFRIKFDKFEDKNLFGLEALNLKRFNGDPSYLREVFAMDSMHRAGVYTAQKSSYSRLFLMVEGDEEPSYLGVYEFMEPLDKQYLKNRFGKNDDGDLWKCLWPAGLNEAEPRDKMGIEDPDNGLSFPYDLKTNKKDFGSAADELEAFIHSLNTVSDADFQAWAEANIDVDILLRSQAMLTLLGSWDDYRVNQNNYYLYRDEDNIWHFIPYDLDNILGTSVMEDPARVNVFALGNDSYPLVRRILNVAAYRRRYAAYILEFTHPATGVLNARLSEERFSPWLSMIAPYIANDTGDNMTMRDEPADWGQYSRYRIGKPSGGSDEWYLQVRSDSARAQVFEEYPGLK